MSQYSMPQNHTWIKICGFTEPENALECAALGPDAIGLIFFEKSPRNVDIEQAKKITAVLPDPVLPVGVLVDKEYDEIMHIVHGCGLKGVQLHGSEPPELVERLLKEHLIVIKALFAKKQPFMDQAKEYDMASALLIEYGKGTLPGGNAESWNYELSRQLKTQVPVILAGGLGPENISHAVSAGKPSGVDVSSGVELSYGIKDIKKVDNFIQKVRNIDKTV